MFSARLRKSNSGTVVRRVEWTCQSKENGMSGIGSGILPDFSLNLREQRLHVRIPIFGELAGLEEVFLAGNFEGMAGEPGEKGIEGMPGKLQFSTD